MQRLRLLFIILLIALFFSSCAQAMAPLSSTLTPTLSPQARAYLTQALDDMQLHSINRKKINWTELRQEAFVKATHAKTPADTYTAITFALQHLGDHHSLFVEPQAATQPGTGGTTSYSEPSGQLLAPGIGYLDLPGFIWFGQAANQYAQFAQDAIGRVDQMGICGWIVDLRYNTGGNMWPMLVGVGPILGEGVAGWFVDADGVKQAWGYSNGQAQYAGSTTTSAVRAYHLKHSLPPVAVLTGTYTASSGEAIMVAFRGRPSTRSFGQPTTGVPTSNGKYTLRDGAELWITVAVDADRTGQTYDSSISPDQEVPSPSHLHPGANDEVEQAALTWLHTQGTCQK
jgi:carboxyl-terminal processing protease